MTSIMTVQELAKQLSAAFETRTRDNGDKFVCLKDGSPQWMTDAIHEAHDDKLPDDTIYRICEKVADAVAESGGDDWEDALYDIEADIYTDDLTRWLAARTDHYSYCDEVLEETEGLTGSDRPSFIGILQAAQLKQINEVGYALLRALDTLAQEQSA